MANGPQVPLKCFVRVVALPLDPLGVHLVVEVARPNRPPDQPDYRAPTTVCGQIGYVQTDRKTIACEECARGYPEASMSARMAARASLGIIDRIAVPNGHAGARHGRR